MWSVWTQFFQVVCDDITINYTISKHHNYKFQIMLTEKYLDYNYKNRKSSFRLSRMKRLNEIAKAAWKKLRIPHTQT